MIDDKKGLVCRSRVRASIDIDDTLRRLHLHSYVSINHRTQTTAP
jgi:hypothetical protein